MSHSPPAFLESDHISARTKAALLKRMQQEQAERAHLSAHNFELLKIVCDDILPQEPLLGEIHLNIAAMIDQSFAGPGDGWRFAELPEDLKAWEEGLSSLNSYAQVLFKTDYGQLTGEQKGELLDAAFEGCLPSSSTASFSPEQMKLWSGDLRNNIVGCFLAHPVAQEKLGISANLTGGDKEIQGFSHDGIYQKETFEP